MERGASFCAFLLFSCRRLDLTHDENGKHWSHGDIDYLRPSATNEHYKTLENKMSSHKRTIRSLPQGIRRGEHTSTGRFVNGACIIHAVDTTRFTARLKGMGLIPLLLVMATRRASFLYQHFALSAATILPIESS